MFTTSPTTPTPTTHDNPWLAWSNALPQEPEALSVAELADCCCPDLCDRDHVNE